MKKVFSKEMWKKFLASVMIIVSLMCIAPHKSQAAAADIGGQLAKPVADLLTVIGDGAVNIIHRIVKGQDTTLLRFEGGVWEYAKTTWNSFVQGVWNVYADTVNVLSRKTLDLFGGEDIELVPWQPKTKEVVDNYQVTLTKYDEDGFEDALVLPIYQVTPEEIFGGTIGLFNVNFFDTSIRQSSNNDVDKTDEEKFNIAEDLQPVIATWYKIIRGICIVGMLSMLVYIGIRILMSSTSENKAKYKQLLVDWGVGFCLLFLLHYGMAFGNMFVDSLIDAITSVNLGSYANIESGKDYTTEEINSVNRNSQYLIIPKSKLEDYIVSETDTEVVIAPEENDEMKMTLDRITVNGEECVIWKTGLMGRLRVDTSYARDTSEAYFGYAILFLVLVFLLCFFTWTYLKRVLYMAFLTIIAPFVALTYPLDKIKDGQAQAFNFWMKEYIYNLLLQPLHLLIYTVLISSAIELASKNILYSIVALGFLVPAEKLIRQMFGFKGNTPGFLPGAAGAALVMSGMKNLLGKAPNEQDNKIDVPKADGKTKMKDVDYGAILGTGNQVLQEQNVQPLGVSTATMGNTQGFVQQTITPTVPISGLPSSGQPSGGAQSNVSPQINGQLSALGQGQAGFPQNNITPALSIPNSQRVKPKPMKYNLAKRMGRSISRRSHPLQVSGQVLRNTGRRISNRVKKIKPTRFVAGAALGAAGAGIGLAAGIASGDASKAFTYATTGLIAGNKAGRGTASVLGVEESISAVNQANMDDIERAKYERDKVLKSDQYRLQMDAEDKKYKAILNQKMADGRTIREAAIDSGYSHSQQVQIAKYALDKENMWTYGSLAQGGHKDKYLAQDLFGEFDNIKKLSNNLGVTNFDVLDSSTRQSKMEQIAKRTDKAEYEELRKQKQFQESRKAALKTPEGKNEAQDEINRIQKRMGELDNAMQVANRINIFGRTED